jgi:hypothetical protein
MNKQSQTSDNWRSFRLWVNWILNGRQPLRTWAQKQRNSHRWKPLPSNVIEDTSLCVMVIFEIRSRALKFSSKSSYQSKTRLSSPNYVTVLFHVLPTSLRHLFSRYMTVINQCQYQPHACILRLILCANHGYFLKKRQLWNRKKS